VIFGVISLIAGIVVISTPVSAVHTLAILMGIWFIVMGVLEMVDAYMTRRMVRTVVMTGQANVPGQRAGTTAAGGREQAPVTDSTKSRK
jgi:hypothetical protein